MAENLIKEQFRQMSVIGTITRFRRNLFFGLCGRMYSFFSSRSANFETSLSLRRSTVLSLSRHVFLYASLSAGLSLRAMKPKREFHNLFISRTGKPQSICKKYTLSFLSTIYRQICGNEPSYAVLVRQSNAPKVLCVADSGCVELSIRQTAFQRCFNSDMSRISASM